MPSQVIKTNVRACSRYIMYIEHNTLCTVGVVIRIHCSQGTSTCTPGQPLFIVLWTLYEG